MTSRAAIAALLTAGCCAATTPPPARPPPLLAESGCDDGTATCASIHLRDDLSPYLVVVKLSVMVDGIESFSLDERTPLRHGDAREVFHGPLAPGPHELFVTLTCRGGGYGVFSMSLYNLVVRFRHAFTVDTTPVAFDVVAYEKGSVTTPIEERPAFRVVPR